MLLTTPYAPRRVKLSDRSTCAALGHSVRKCPLKHSVSNLHSVFGYSPGSPIAQLSNEELLLVFEAAVEDAFYNATAFGKLQNPHILVIISQVCHRWRAIALSNTGLWMRITFFSSSLSEVERHLSRSGTRPLSIYGKFPVPKGEFGYLFRKDESAAIATALVEKACRWKTLVWIDRSADNLLHLLETRNAYPAALERLDLAMSQGIVWRYGADNWTPSNTSRFPALRHLSLTGIHPSILPRRAMPSLLTLKLNGLGRNLFFSQLNSLLSGTPTLRMLTIQNTFPMPDLYHLSTMGTLGPNNGPFNGIHRTRKVTLPALNFLSLQQAPAWTVWVLLYYLELPALTKLDLHVYSYPYSPDLQWISHDGRLVMEDMPQPPTPSILSRNDWVIPLPTLRTLRMTYYTSPAPVAPAPGIDLPVVPPATATEDLPQLRRLAFPSLTDLELVHRLVPNFLDPSPAVAPPSGPPCPLPPLDTLFQAPDLRNLVRLSLVGFALPLGPLCNALRTRMPALERLSLTACAGAGALVCALAPGECGGGCERWLGNVDGDGDGCGDVWIGMKVRVVVVSKCADVRVGCLRKVVDARLRANMVSAAGLGLRSVPFASSSEASAGSDSATRVEIPRMITHIRVVDCPGLAKEDVAALAAIPGSGLHLIPHRTMAK